MNFLKQKFGYGLAGGFVAALLVTTVSQFTHQISDLQLWLIPLGFIAGLVLPKKIIATRFFAMINGQGHEAEADEVQKGPVVWLVRIFGVLILAFLLFVVGLIIKDAV